MLGRLSSRHWNITLARTAYRYASPSTSTTISTYTSSPSPATAYATRPSPEQQRSSLHTSARPPGCIPATPPADSTPSYPSTCDDSCTTQSATHSDSHGQTTGIDGHIAGQNDRYPNLLLIVCLPSPALNTDQYTVRYTERASKQHLTQINKNHCKNENTCYSGDETTPRCRPGVRSCTIGGGLPSF